LFPNLGHYDFASSECVGNRQGQDEKQGLGMMDQDFSTMASKISSAVSLSSWAIASEKALSFSDNQNLTPGHNYSKVYPEDIPRDIQVLCIQVPIPNSNPQVYINIQFNALLQRYLTKQIYGTSRFSL